LLFEFQSGKIALICTFCVVCVLFIPYGKFVELVLFSIDIYSLREIVYYECPCICKPEVGWM